MRTFRVRPVVLLLGILIPLVSASAATAKPRQSDPPPVPPIEVVGGWVNDVGCIPAGGGATDDPHVFAAECAGTTTWNGDLSGKTILHVSGTVATDGSMQGEFEELFVGTYLGDRSTGALLTRGAFTIDSKGAFRARATIVGGTCDWSGSSGSLAFDGYQLNGGYVGTWFRPPVTPSSTPCTPIESVDDVPRPSPLR